MSLDPTGTEILQPCAFITDDLAECLECCIDRMIERLGQCLETLLADIEACDPEDYICVSQAFMRYTQCVEANAFSLGMCRDLCEAMFDEPPPPPPPPWDIPIQPIPGDPWAPGPMIF